MGIPFLMADRITAMSRDIATATDMTMSKDIATATATIMSTVTVRKRAAVIPAEARGNARMRPLLF